MLQFNPYYRPTAKECLQHKVFDKIRVAGLESNAPFKINIDADRNEYKFDYEQPESKFSEADDFKLITTFKHMVLEEIYKLKSSTD